MKLLILLNKSEKGTHEEMRNVSRKGKTFQRRTRVGKKKGGEFGMRDFKTSDWYGYAGAEKREGGKQPVIGSMKIDGEERDIIIDKFGISIPGNDGNDDMQYMVSEGSQTKDMNKKAKQKVKIMIGLLAKLSKSGKVTSGELKLIGFEGVGGKYGVGIKD